MAFLTHVIHSPVVADGTMANQDWLKHPHELLDSYGIDVSTDAGVAEAASMLGMTPAQFRELPVYQNRDIELPEK